MISDISSCGSDTQGLTTVADCSVEKIEIGLNNSMEIVDKDEDPGLYPCYCRGG